MMLLNAVIGLLGMLLIQQVHGGGLPSCNNVTIKRVHEFHFELRLEEGTVTPVKNRRQIAARTESLKKQGIIRDTPGLVEHQPEKFHFCREEDLGHLRLYVKPTGPAGEKYEAIDLEQLPPDGSLCRNGLYHVLNIKEIGEARKTTVEGIMEQDVELQIEYWMRKADDKIITAPVVAKGVLIIAGGDNGGRARIIDHSKIHIESADERAFKEAFERQTAEPAPSTIGWLKGLATIGGNKMKPTDDNSGKESLRQELWQMITNMVDEKEPIAVKHNGSFTDVDSLRWIPEGWTCHPKKHNQH